MKLKYALAAVVSGVLIAVMIMLNGQLTQAMGNFPATVVIHAVGLCVVLLLLLVQRKGLHPGQKMPIHLYLGGVVGVLTTVFNNFSVVLLNVSVTLALMLLGQLFSSLVIDKFGLLGAPKRPLHWDKILSVVVVMAGVVIMML